jgi:hypothetical protein
LRFPDVVGQSTVFAHEFLQALFVGIDLLAVDSNSVSVFVDFLCKFGGLGSGESDVFLGLLHFSA